MSKGNGYGWLLTHSLYASRLPGGAVRFESACFARDAGYRSSADYRFPAPVVLTYRAGKLRFNGKFRDVGDDLPCYLGLLDEVPERTVMPVFLPAE